MKTLLDIILYIASTAALTVSIAIGLEGYILPAIILATLAATGWGTLFYSAEQEETVKR